MLAREKVVGISMSLPEVEVLGVPITCLTSYREAVVHITHRIKTGDRLYCVAINPVKVCTAQKSETLSKVLKNAGIHICDGIGTALAVRFLHGRRICRITGVQLFFHLVETAAQEGLGVFLLGASEESNESAARNLLQKYPGLRIVGRHHGYYDDEAAIVDLINNARPDILFVAMGSPKQEYWIAEHREQLSCPFIMGVGGTFDVASGKVKWAPAIFRRTGTEFLYRFCCQPWRFKNSASILRFAFAVLRERFLMRSSARSPLAG